MSPLATDRGNDRQSTMEATVRFAAELGYQVTMVRDATADYSDEEMHAALDVNISDDASAVVTTEEVVGAISALSTSRTHEALIR